MCKTQTWKYLCGCFYNHRLSTCRGFTQSNGRAVCLGSRCIPVIASDMLCASCLKKGIIEIWREDRTKDIKDARSQGKRTGPIHREYSRMRAELESYMPKDVLTVNRPKPIRTWKPNGPSVLRREVKVEDLAEEEAGREDQERTAGSEPDIGTDSEPSAEENDLEMEFEEDDDTTLGFFRDHWSLSDLEGPKQEDYSMEMEVERDEGSSEKGLLDPSQALQLVESVGQEFRNIDPALLSLSEEMEE
ncbi:hypothetical protein BST61_g1007 [Cercospora zeina]